MTQPANRRLVTEEILDEVSSDLTTELEAQERGEQVFSDIRYTGSSIAGLNSIAIALGGLTAVVPPSTTAQNIYFAAPYSLSVTGGGYFTLQLYDYTNGVAVLQQYTQKRIESTHPVTSAGDKIQGVYRMSPHEDYRLMQVFFTMTRDVGSSLQLNVPAIDTEYAKLTLQVVKE